MKTVISIILFYVIFVIGCWLSAQTIYPILLEHYGEYYHRNSLIYELMIISYLALLSFIFYKVIIPKE